MKRGIPEIGIGLVTIAVLFLPWIEINSSLFMILNTQQAIGALELIGAGAWPVLVACISAWICFGICRFSTDASKGLRVVPAVVSFLSLGLFVLIFVQGVEFSSGSFGITEQRGVMSLREGTYVAFGGVILLLIGAFQSPTISSGVSGSNTP